MGIFYLYFTAKSKESGVCKICPNNKEIKTTNYTTHGLVKHLTSIHRMERDSFVKIQKHSMSSVLALENFNKNSQKRKKIKFIAKKLKYSSVLGSVLGSVMGLASSVLGVGFLKVHIILTPLIPSLEN